MPLRVNAIRKFDPLAEPVWAQTIVNLFAKGYEHPAKTFLRLLASLNRQPLRWLDIGAGRNWLIGIFKENHPEDIALGIDIVIPTELINKKRFVVANAYDLPFRNNTFDIVTAYWVVEHISTPEKFLSQVHRVLSPGGYFLLRTTNPLSPFVRISRNLPQGIKKRVLGRFTRPNHIFYKTYDCFNHPNRLRKLPCRFGFKVLTIEFLESLMLFNPLTAIVSVLFWQLTRVYPPLRTDIVALYQK